MLITAPEIDTELLWGLSIFFVCIALVYFVSIFIFRNRISSKSSLTKRRKMELSPMVIEFLFYEDDANVAEKSHYIGLKIEIRELLKDDFNRRILTEILLDLRKDVSGDTQKKLFGLYEDLELEKDAFIKLDSWRWEVISKGILELTVMEVDEAYTFIVKFINDRRGIIREQAEIATVTLKQGGVNYFLDTTKYRISEWQQLKLLDVLRNKENFNPPRFKAWLTSTNKHVVLFALRLIKFYNQNDANIMVIELVKHKDQQVRRQAIYCIKEFYIIEALPILKKVFWNCTVDTKIAILGAIAKLGGKPDIEFLESVSQREGDFSVKSKAVGAINAISPESIMPTENIEHITAYASPTFSSEEISDSNETNNPSQKPVLMSEKNETGKALRDKEVTIEQVTAEPSEENVFDNASNSDISEIRFLPPMVADTTDTEESLKCAEPKNELLAEPMDNELQTLIDEIRELDFLPIVNDEQSHFKNHSLPASNENAAKTLKTIEGYSLTDLEFSFEKATTPIGTEPEETPKFDLEEASITDIDHEDVNDAMSWVLEDNQLRQIECTYETVAYPFNTEIFDHLIPEPIYYDDYETYMMGLLDDLEEMGDQREIPLLHELMAEEGKSFIKDRITDMIDKFTRQSATKTKTNTSIKEKIELPVFSVFADLFNSIDTEEKLILLDEVIHVGDEKEIEFLDGLLEDPDQNLREKAQAVLELLIAKLTNEKPEAIYSKGVTEIVSEYIDVKTTSEDEKYESLLSELDIEPNLSPETFDIDFELCDTLDKKHDQKILDIQVTSTEVPRKEDGGSFFNSLRNLSRLF